MAPAWKKDRRVPVADPGRTAKEETTWKRTGVAEEEVEVQEERERDTEGTCYALRDMAEARGIHNFVKTKMLRSCLGGVAFFLVSRNVQARLSLRPSSSAPPCPFAHLHFAAFSLLPLSAASLFLLLFFVLLVSSLSELPPRIIPFSFLR